MMVSSTTKILGGLLAPLLFCYTVEYAAANAQPCAADVAELNTAVSAADIDGLTTALAALEANTTCSDNQVQSAQSFASGAIARIAQGQFAAGDITAASNTLSLAPSLHWAIQAVRGDIEAKQGRRAEAAQLYNSALDTLGDARLTKQVATLEGAASRLAQLAQENMMLAGTMESTLTRGPNGNGVMGMLARGIVQERVQNLQAAKPIEAEDGGQADNYVATTTNTYNVVAAAAKDVSAVFLPIRFDFDSDALNAKGIREAKNLAAFLIANNPPSLLITGHTDDVGSDDYNFDLSRRRAEGLKHFLEKSGVKTPIETIGKGERHPPDLSDQTIYSLDERRAIARRIEVSFGAY